MSSHTCVSGMDTQAGAGACVCLCGGAGVCACAGAGVCVLKALTLPGLESAWPVANSIVSLTMFIFTDFLSIARDTCFPHKMVSSLLILFTKLPFQIY